jgi:exopolysaccharide biosynthesis polyprenyl glycosylphosphotransferase
MLQRHQEFYSKILKTIDIGLLIISFGIAYLLRVYVVPQVSFVDQGIQPFSTYLPFLFVLPTIGILMLQREGIYHLHLPNTFSHFLIRSIRGIILTMAILFFIFFLFRVPQESISRGVFLLFAPTSVVFLGAREAFLRMWLRQKVRVVSQREHVLLIGSAQECEYWHRLIRKTPGQQLEAKGMIDLEHTHIAQLIEAIHTESINLVVMNLGKSLSDKNREVISVCEAEGVEIWVTADFFKTSIATSSFDSFLGHSVLVYRTTHDASWGLLFKHTLDYILAFIGLVLTSPVLILTSIAIFITSGGPVLFRQKRSGVHGRPFTLYKFRTMQTDAEQLQAELQAQNIMSGPVFKMENDPRITPLGAILRKYSIDELPQLWNVLSGSMSLVGPRPLPLNETNNFSNIAQRRRMSVKPGLTCLWQISGRSQIKEFKEWIRLDLEYIDRWNFWLDIEILFKTIPAVLFGRGAK